MLPAPTFFARLAAALALASALLAAPLRAQQAPDPRIVQEIYDCLAVGLPKDWKRAWVDVNAIASAEGTPREYEARFFFATSTTDMAGKPLDTCGSHRIAQAIRTLRADLPEDKRDFKGLTLTFTSDGKFDLYYDYGK